MYMIPDALWQLYSEEALTATAGIKAEERERFASGFCAFTDHSVLLFLVKTLRRKQEKVRLMR